jgi:cytochrome P450 family 4
MITPTFHFKILDSFVEVFSDKSKILISKLQKEVGSEGFNVYPYITRCALDIICGELRAKVRFSGTWAQSLV